MDILEFFPSWLLPTTLLLFFPCIFIYTIGWKCSSMATLKLPPAPWKLPVIGNLHQVLGKGIMHQTIWNLSETYGPTMLLHFGAQPYLVISSTEMAGEVLKTHDQKLCTRPYSKGGERVTYNYKDAVFTPNSDHWRDMRKVLQSEFFGAKRSRLLKKVMEIEMEGVVRSLSLNSLGTPVNVEDMILSLVTDVVCKVALGKSYRENTFNGKTMKEILDETLAMVGGSSTGTFPTFGWILDILSGYNDKLEKCFSHLDSFLQTVLDEHLDQKETKSSDHQNDFVDDCISRLTADEMKALVMNVLQGSIDTTKTAMVWTVSEIVKNPRVMQKLQAEIRSCVGRKSSVHESDLTKMTYLKMVVKETLRLHPPAAFLMIRECETHCQVGGYDVLPGTNIMVNVWAIGRDPRIWKENPTEFRPERFETMQVEFGGIHFEMIPFGGGRRACPGYNFALSIVEYTIANLFYLFNWETPDGVKKEDLNMEEHGHALIGRKTPLYLVPIKHDWQD